MRLPKAKSALRSLALDRPAPSDRPRQPPTLVIKRNYRQATDVMSSYM